MGGRGGASAGVLPAGRRGCCRHRRCAAAALEGGRVLRPLLRPLLPPPGRRPPAARRPAGLGLEVSLDDRLRWKSEERDVETASPQPGAAAAGRQAVRRIKALAKDVARQGASGAVSLRVGLLIAYLVVLHIAVMISFTKSNESRLLSCDPTASHVLP